MSTAREALDRTLLLMRDDVVDDVPDAALLDALRGHPVLVSADAANLESEAAQHALIATALLCARMGVPVFVDAPNVPLRGIHAPLTGPRLVDALLDIGADLVPGVEISADPAGPLPSSILVGDTGSRGRRQDALVLDGDAWTGRARREGVGERWREVPVPVGPLASAGLAAAEVFKAAMRRLSHGARSPGAFRSLHAPCRVASLHLGGASTAAVTGQLGAFDVISGGAIAQAALYTLARVPGVTGQARVIEPERGDLTNVNRYSFLRRSRVGMLKVDDLASYSLGELDLVGVPSRFDDEFLGRHGPLRPDVLVGVDDIPSRWAVQRANPAWVGVGATTHHSAMASFHRPGIPCARCLHPRDEAQNGPIPTVSFVSHMAGVLLAAIFLRHRAGERLPLAAQQIYLATLRADSRSAFWMSPVAARANCPFGCAQANAA